MTRLPPQLELPGTDAVANDVSIDDVLGGSRRVSPLATMAGPDAPVVERRQANVARGRLSQRHGAEFEAWLTAQHNAMTLNTRERLLSWAIHIEPPTKVKGRTSTGEKRLKFSGKAHADFVAMSTRAWGSRVIVVEAKSITGAKERLYIDDVLEQQRAHLSATRAEGGVAVLAVEWRVPQAPGFVDAHHRFAMLWGDVPWKVGGRGGWSIGLDDCKGFEMPPETGPRRAFYLRRFLEVA